MGPIDTESTPSTEPTVSDRVSRFPSPTASRFLALDAVRGVAALLVATYHIAFVAPCLNAPEAILAVDLFFCLSGVVLAEAYGQRLAEGLRWRAFMGLRLVRLYPMYLVSLIVGVTVVTVRPHDSATAATLIIMALCILPLGGGAAFPLNGPAWSLCDEFIGSAAFGTILGLPRWRCVKIWLALSVLLTGCYFTLGRTNVDVGTTTATFPLSVLRMLVSVFAGVCVHAAFRAARRPPIRLIEGNPGTYAVLLLVGFTLTLRPSEHWRLAYELVVVTAIFPILVYAAMWCRPTGALSKIAVWGAATSYPLYILHEPVLMLTKIIVTGNPRKLPATLPAWSGWALIGGLLALSWLCSVAIDRPLRRFAGAMRTRQPIAADGFSTAAPSP